MSRLYIACKAPRPGTVKTRLARDVGTSRATRLYAAFLRDLATQFPVAGWFVTPDGAWPEIAAAASANPNAPSLDQGSGSWGERQDRFFAFLEPTPADPVILIASDSPQVTPELIAGALDHLVGNDLVFGPVHDGGYWLVGMRRYHDLLADIPMSSADVLTRVLAEAGRRGLSVGLLATEFDVDQAADLPALEAAASRGALVATRAELAALRTITS